MFLFFPFGKKFGEIFESKRKWYRKYLWFLLFSVLFFIVVLINILLEEEPYLPLNRLLSVVGLFLYISTGVFFIMLIKDIIEQIKSILLKIVSSITLVIGLLIWIFIAAIWMINLLDF